MSALRACSTPQEIGCHSFAHERADQLTPEEFRWDVRACLEMAAARGIRLEAYVFPWNVEAHHDVLAAEGFTCYRQTAPAADRSSTVGRARRLALDLALAAPPTVLPRRDPTGLWAVPPSMSFAPRRGLRRVLVPIERRRDQALRGLDAAVRDQRMFHLWFHPVDLASEPERLLRALDAILARAAALRKGSRLDVLTMGEVARRCEVVSI